MKNIYRILQNITVFVAGLFTLIFWINMEIVRADESGITVVMSERDPPYEEALSGFQQVLHKQSIPLNYDVFVLEGNASKVDSVVKKIKKNRPDLIFTLGSLATEKIFREVDNIPIVAGMVLRWDSLKKPAHSTGIFLEFPVETQFEWMHRVLPMARNIGAIYCPQANQGRMEHASRVASHMGLRLEAQKVHAPQDLPEALNRLAKKAEVFWGVTDDLVLNPQTAKYLLVFSFRKRIPFIGLSPTWVKAGALYSLDWDYADIGAQCGETALKILQGVPVSSISLSPPRKVFFTVNLKTAQHMRIKIPEELLREANQIF